MLAPQITLKVRPNNQISLTVGNFRKKLPTVSQSHTHLDDRIHPWQIADQVERTKKGADKYLELKDVYKYRLKPPLDIISNLQRPKKAPSCKLNTPKNFTRQSGQKLRECGAAMQIACGGDVRFCHEVTLTLPANTSEAFKALAAHTAYIINRLFEPIRKRYGEMCLRFFVWEYQERGALHLHIAVYHPDECEGLYICSQIIDQWQKILCDVSDMSGVWLLHAKCIGNREMQNFYQYHTMPIQKDVGRYFAKYAGKQESKNNWYVRKYPVSQFWGSSKTIKNIIKENSFECSWDYFASQDSKEAKLTEIIENILAKIQIVSVSSYDFDIKLSGKHRLNRYQNGRKILVTDEEKSIANGTRYTFYCEQKDFGKALNFCRGQDGVF